jgi:hypothetical protein
MLMRAKLGMRMLALLAAVLLTQDPVELRVKFTVVVLAMHAVQTVELLQVAQLDGQAVQPA